MIKVIAILVTGMLLVAGSVSAQTVSETMIFPEPTGAYAVGRVERTWIDPSREEVFTASPDDLREVSAYIWYPAVDDDAPVASWLNPVLAPVYSEQFGLPLEMVAELVTVHARSDAGVAVSETPFPVLIMSHGNSWFPELYTTLAESLASHGYVVIGVRHTYNAAAALLTDGTVVRPVPAADATGFTIPPNATQLDILEMSDRHAQGLLAVQVGDLRFVLDQAERMNADDPVLAGSLDLSHVGVFGHSFGGAAAIDALLADERFDAAALIDGSLYSDMSAGRDRPILALFAVVTLSGPNEAELASLGLNPDELERLTSILGRVRTLVEASPGSVLVSVAGAQHINFGDAGLLGGLIDG
ncbi:MAG: hypothetical protein SF029_03310, partial [bacterium]|nr:hypothetical protein [bacterium]